MAILVQIERLLKSDASARWMCFSRWTFVFLLSVLCVFAAISGLCVFAAIVMTSVINIEVDSLGYSRLRPDPSVTAYDLANAMGRFLSLYRRETAFSENT